MDLISLAVPLLYWFLVLALSGYLLMRGVTHVFVALFAAGAVMHLIQSGGIVFMRMAPGGFGANMRYLPVLQIIGFGGIILTGAAFVLLASFLLRRDAPKA
ncbi:MAG TPA: hypothetical protein VF551_00795 [Chthoniobacterales bacterium]